MTRRVREELAHVELLLENGEYKKALELVEALTKYDNISFDDRLVCALLESRLRVKLGELEKARVLVDKFLKTAREQQNSMLIVDFITVKAEVFWRLGKLDEGTRAVEEGEELLIGMDQVEEWKGEIKRRKGELLHHKGIIYWYRGELNQALEHYQQSLKIKEELGNRKGIADSLNNLGLVYWSKGELNQALEHYQQSLKINKEIGNKKGIAVLLNNLGNVYRLRGELNQALEHYQQSLTISEKLGDKQDITKSLNNLGTIYRLKGELNQALEHYQQSLTISEKLGNKHDIALALNNLGDVYDLKGELNQALEYHQQSLKINKEIGNRLHIALSLCNVGSIYMKKENADLALEYYQQGLSIYEELGNEPLSAVVLSELVWFTLENDKSTLAKQYLQRLQQIKDQTDNRIIDQRYRVAKALSLKTSKRSRHKAEAEEILEQVIEEEISDHSLTVTAMIHLCDLLLSELKMTGDEEVLEKVEDLTHRLLDIAQEQSSHSLLTETYLLQSKLALIELDIGRAKKLLAKAYRISKEKGLHKLAHTVAHERNLLLSQLENWEATIGQKPSKAEMIDLTRLNDLLERMIRQTVANIAEEEKRITKEKAPKSTVRKIALPDRISTGYGDLDDLLLGGIPKNYAVVLTAPPCDERDQLIEQFLDAGIKKGQMTIYITRRITGINKLLQRAPSNFHTFIINPQAERLIKNFQNITKFKGVEDINNINIELKKFCDKLDDASKEPRRICIEIVSDVLLHHKTVQTRRWLSDLIPRFTLKGFTILAMMNPRMHRTEEYQAILEIFDGEISIIEKKTAEKSEKTLKIQKMYNQKYMEDELLIKKRKI
ncbi:MAG: tetratricopeptide repeat protein [Candidatus Bathyarchaeota archaeon]